MHEKSPEHSSEHVKSQNFLRVFPQTPLTQSISWGPTFFPPSLDGPGCAYNHGWMNPNKLKVNPAKRFVMLIGTRQSFHVQRMKVVVDKRLSEHAPLSNTSDSRSTTISLGDNISSLS